MDARLALERLNELQRDAIGQADYRRIFEAVLDLLLDVTQSALGFIGETPLDENGQAFLRIQAITNIAWNDDTRALHAQLESGGFILDNPRSLIGQVIAQRRPIIANDPAHDPRRHGLPPGHPPLTSYLGVPLLRGSEIIGMVGLANRPSGFDESVVSQLEPILATCTTVIAAHRDALARSEAEAALAVQTQTLQRANDELADLALVFHHTHDCVALLAPNGCVSRVNHAFAACFSRPMEAFAGEPLIDVLRDHTDTPGLSRIEQLLATLGQQPEARTEITARSSGRAAMIIDVQFSRVDDRSGHIRQIVVLCRDVTREREERDALEYAAQHDALTGLANRALMEIRLHDALRNAATPSESDQTYVAVGVLDLDGFKPINDRFGHVIGDKLLCALAERMQTTLRASDTLARLGGDEFVVVLPRLRHPDEARAVLERLAQQAARGLSIDGHALRVTTSVGFTLFPQQDDVGAEQLLRQADQAMYAAKIAGKNCVVAFDAAAEHSIRKRYSLLDRIAEGLLAGEFVAHFQPRIRLADGQPVGAEALVRWNHPDGGLLAPGAFLPEIEGHTLMAQLGDEVRRQALAVLEQARQLGHDICISINLSAHELDDPELVERFRADLARYPNLPGHAIELEILESHALGNLHEAAARIDALRELGLRIALDDFGTGYSTLTYLRHLSADVIKIDKSFVQNMDTDSGDANMVRAILALADSFDRIVVAEGIEQPEQIDTLKAMGCAEGQGYGIARPMPADDLIRWLQHQSVSALQTPGA